MVKIFSNLEDHGSTFLPTFPSKFYKLARGIIDNLWPINNSPTPLSYRVDVRIFIYLNKSIL